MRLCENWIKTLDYFHENGLFTATGANGIMIVGQTRITNAQYATAAEVLKNTNNNGFTPKQQEQRDADARGEAERQKNNTKFGSKY